MVSAQFRESYSLSEQPNACYEPAHWREAGTLEEGDASGQKRREGRPCSEFWLQLCFLPPAPYSVSRPFLQTIVGFLHLSGCLDFHEIFYVKC